MKRQLTASIQEKTKAATESQEKVKETATLKRENSQMKNAQTNLQREINNLKKKMEEQGKSHNVELAKLKKEIDVSKADGGEAANNLRKELEEAKTAIATKDDEQKALQENIAANEAELKKLKDTVSQLRKIGSKFRSQYQDEEKKSKGLLEEKEKLTDEIAKLKAEVPSEASTNSGEELDEAPKLIEQAHNRLAVLETENEELKKDKEDLTKKYAEKQARAKVVLSNAKERITRVENENKELKIQLENLSGNGSGSSDEGELRKKALASQLTSVRQEKDKIEAEKNLAVQEKEKPVTPGARKQQQPTTAHIQPHRVNPPREFTQTASIRPMAQRATSQAVVLPSQVSSAQLEVATVQPTVTVSPSNPQQPTTSQPLLLDPSAPEFVPSVSVASASSDSSEDTPRAVITPRQDQPQ